MNPNTHEPTLKQYVVGLGEVGGSLLENIAEHAPVLGIDLDTPAPDAPCSVMHVCIGMRDAAFVGTVVEYVERYAPELLIVHSTVVPGTCRKIAGRVSCPVAHSPIRGKHANMKADQRRYSKFVAGVTKEAGDRAAEVLEAAGFHVRRMSSTETTEFAKISSTTYFGLLIAWAQELERFSDRFDLDQEEIVEFYDEIAYFPSANFFPGIIGGHCVMPNIALLKQVGTGPLIEAIGYSNELKMIREASATKRVA